MKYTPAHMLEQIERNLQFVPQKDRVVLEPIIGAMHAGQVTPLSDETRMRIHRTFVLHCLAS